MRGMCIYIENRETEKEKGVVEVFREREREELVLEVKFEGLEERGH